MSQHGPPQQGGQAMGAVLQKSAPLFKPLLQLDEPWTVWDIDELDELDGDNYQQLMEKLKAHGAVQVVGQKTDTRTVDREDRPNSTTTFHANQYVWTPRAKRLLKEATDHDETLPCGHRVHIKNHGNGTFGCRYCSENRQYDRETIENRL